MTCDLNQQVRTKSDSHGLITALVKELSEKFPSIDAEILSTEDIQERFGSEFDNKKGFVHNAKVVINRDLATIDTPLHEFGHLYLKVLKVENPKRYVEIIKSTEEFVPQLEELSKKYPELSQEDLQEEFFVHHLGYETSALLGKFGDSPSISLFRKLLDRFKHWLVGITSTVGFSGTNLKNVNSFNDILHQVGYEIMSPTFKQFVDPRLLDNIRFQKASKISDELDLLDALIVTDNKDFTKKGKDASSFAKQVLQLIENDKKTTKTEIRGGESYNKRFITDGTRELGEKELSNLSRFVDTFFSDVSSGQVKGKENVKVVSLVDLHKESGYSDLKDTFKDYKHILVKIRYGELTFFDLSGKPMQGIHNATLNRKNIAGVHISDYEAKKLGLTYTSNKVDVAKLQLGIIALRVQSKVKDPKNVKIGKIFITDAESIDDKNKVVRQGTYIDEIVNDLQKLNSIPSISKLFDGDLKNILSKPLNADDLRINVEDHYTRLIQGELNRPTFSKYAEEKARKNKNIQNILDIIKDKKEKHTAGKLQDLIDALSERKQLIQDPDNTLKGINSFYDVEVELLNRYIAELVGTRDLYRQSDNFTVSTFQSFIDSIARTGNPILDKLFEYMTLAASKVRSYMTEFRTKDTKVLEELISEYRSVSPGSFIEEFTLNDARKFFLPLIEYQEAYDPTTNKKISVRTGRFIQAGSKEYKDLTPKQKEYLNHFNKEADKSLKKIHGNDVSSVGFIPIMRRSSEDTFKEMVKNPSRTWELMKEGFQKSWDEGIDNYEYHLEDNKSNSVAFDSFMGQHDNPDKLAFGNKNRLEKIGLRYEGGKLIVTDLKKNNDMETDLSYVLNSFVASNVRKAEFDRIQPITDSLKSFLLQNKELFSNVTDQSLAMFEDYYTRVVNDTMSDAVQMKNINKIVSQLQSKASLAILSMKLGTDIKNLTTGWMTTAKEAIFNSLLGEGFSLLSLTKAHAYITADATKDAVGKSVMNKLNLKFGFYNMDFQQITSRQHLETTKSLFKSKNWFLLNRIGDVFNRRLCAGATFIQEGSLQAYSLDKDDNLVYDEKKDLRFYNKDGSQTNLQKMFLKAVKDDMVREGGLDQRGNLLYGHTIKQRNAMKSNMDRIYGSYDKDHSSRMQSYAWGKAFESLRVYFMDKQRRYIGVGKNSTKMYSENEGMYVPVYDPKGNVIAYEWQGESQEAVLASVMMSGRELFANKGNVIKTWKNLTSKGRRNLMYILVDTATFALLLAAFRGITGDDDDDGEQDMSEFIAMYALKGMLEASSGLADIGVNYEGEIRVASSYTGMMEKPFFAASYWADISIAINNLLFGNNTEFQDEKDLDKVLDNIPWAHIGTGHRVIGEVEKLADLADNTIE